MRLTLIALLLALLSLTACTHTYYVVRHAEKAASPPSDPPLTTAGQERAQALKELLKAKPIKGIYSTNFLRTKGTAEPLSAVLGLTIQTYGPAPDPAFITQMKQLKHSVLIVGHSNTVDNIVNGLTNTTSVAGDLPDTEYDNLFVVKYKKFFGTTIRFEQRRYGAPAH